MSEAELQDLIKERYSELIKEARENLCKHCRLGEFYNGQFIQCHHGLLPIQSDGSVCNYFLRK
jgi:hypothetical protein